VAQRSAAAGRRLLDVFTLHFYPQGGEFSEDVSSAMQLRRATDGGRRADAHAH
jgi:hypothetical protein